MTSKEKKNNQNNKLGTDKEIWEDKRKVSDGVREEEET